MRLFLPGEHVQPRESMVDALSRELSEEFVASREGDFLGVVEHQSSELEGV